MQDSRLNKFLKSATRTARAIAGLLLALALLASAFQQARIALDGALFANPASPAEKLAP